MSARRPALPALLLLVVLVAPGLAQAQVPAGWEKVSGMPDTSVYSGVPDGLLPAGDRQNSYAWSMSVLGRHLYVGSNRNAFSLMVQQMPPVLWPSLMPTPVPYPSDMRARIFRLGLDDGLWEEVPVTPPAVGTDNGYRMMKTFAGANLEPVLYAGSGGIGVCRLLALDGTNPPLEVFRSEMPGRFLSIRAIEEHDGRLYWATEDAGGPALFVSSDPLAEHLADPRADVERIGLPREWQEGGGAEVGDLISYNGWMYVFFFTRNPDPTKYGFWCARVKKMNGKWQWKLIVGDAGGALYPAGLGVPDNGVAVPFRFRNAVYVGALDGAAFRALNGMAPAGGKVWGASGMQLWRFDQRDRWTRVMPAEGLEGDSEVAARGFGNPNNKYLWRLGTVDGRLYVGTFDVGTGLQVLNPPMAPPVVLPNPAGFDLYSTRDGTNWQLETQDGFGDPWNYGARSFATDPVTGDLFLGTANPFYGCQVWRKRAASR